MSSWLCIGNGTSLNQYEEYIVYNNYDYRIGTKLQMKNAAWNLDYTAAADLYAVEEMLKQYPHWRDQIVSRKTAGHKLKVKSPRLQEARDVTGTIQCRWAIENGATHITTVAYDSLSNEWQKHTEWEWLGRNLDIQMLKPDRLEAKQYKLLHTWSTQIRQLEQLYPKIVWQHKHIGNINE